MPNICAAAAALMLVTISCFPRSKTSSRFFVCFLSLALRFCNHIFTCKMDFKIAVSETSFIAAVGTCLSESSNACANSAFRLIVMYLLKWNSLSSSSL